MLRRFFALAMAAAIARAAFSAPQDAAGKIVLTCANSAGCDVNGTLTLQSLQDSSIQLSAPVAHGVALVTPDDRAKQWEASLAADGFWMPRRQMQAPFAAQRLEVWRTAQLTGRFVPPAQAELPKAFEISAQSPFGAAPPLVAEGTAIACPLAADGSWNCALPATVLDLAFRVRGFTPHYHWDAKLRAGRQADVGTVTLRRGASLVVWLERATVKQLKGTARGRLSRMVMADASTEAQRLNQPVAEGEFNGRGMLQLAPLAAGTYSLEIAAPGFAPRTLDQLEVYPGSESALRQAIRLDPPLSIQVTVNPPRDPHGNPWTTEMIRVAEVTGRAVHAGGGKTDDAGAFTLSGQAPGKFVVNVRDSHDNRFVSRQVSVTGPSAASIAVNVENLTLAGTVTIDKQPLAARLLFGGNGGKEQIRAEANDAGEFQVTLPRAGRWIVDVSAESEAVRAAAEVHAKSGVHLEIELPDTEVTGWVTSPDGSRAASANVVFMTSAGSVGQSAGANGSFRFRGLAPGAAEVHARDSRTGEYSAVHKIQLAPGTHVRDLEIELQGLRKFSGSVFSQGQPVAGARVIGYGFAGGPARQERAVSGPDGAFELSLPASATNVTLIVASAGRTLQAFSGSPSQQPTRLELAPVGGTLRLTLPVTATRPRVMYGEIDLPVTDLMQWAAAHGKRVSGQELEIPEMAPGPYRFCVDRGPATNCENGVLAPGSVLSLTIR